MSISNNISVRFRFVKALAGIKFGVRFRVQTRPKEREAKEREAKEGQRGRLLLRGG